MPVDFFPPDGDVKGGFLIFEKNETKKIKFDKIDLGAAPIEILENWIVLAGENPLHDGDSLVQIAKINIEDFSFEWCENYYVGTPRTFNTSINSIEGNLYTLNVNNLFQNETVPRELFLLSVDTNGVVRWSRQINTHARLTLGWIMLTSEDENLIISSSINYYNKLGRFSQLIKINTAGEILWNYEGEEELDNGAVPTWATELSDSTILQTYYVDRRDDVDFIVNQWFPEPNKFIWLSKDGEWIKEKYIVTDKPDFLYYDGVKSGAGDYFYAYGYLEDTRPVLLDQIYAHLTKFSNNGDTIWSRNYQHPSYPQGNVIHTIKDVLEEDNGDITVLADIRAPGAKVEVWLFKINSEGCYVNEECEDMSDITSTTSVEDHKTVLYPNPTSGMVHVECAAKIRHISVMDIAGKLISRYFIDGSNTNIDLGAFEDGVNIFQIVDEGGKVETRKVIKL